MRRILALAAVAAIGLTAYRLPHWVFASEATKPDDPSRVDASHAVPSSSMVDRSESNLTDGHSSTDHRTTGHSSSDHPSTDHPSTSTGDPSLFWGDLTPGATEACPHSTDGAHHHAAPGLAFAELFPTPHDCGGFHGDQMMVAALFDINIPIELKRWAPAVYLAKR